MEIHCGLDIKKFRKIKYELSSNDYVIFPIWEFFKKNEHLSCLKVFEPALNPFWMNMCKNEITAAFLFIQHAYSNLHILQETPMYYLLLDLVLSRGNLLQCMQALLGITRHQECSPPGYHKSFSAQTSRAGLLHVSVLVST